MSLVTEVFQIRTQAGAAVDVLVKRDPEGRTYAFARFDAILTGLDFDRLYDEACRRCGYASMHIENRGSYLRLGRTEPAPARAVSPVSPRPVATPRPLSSLLAL